MAASARLPNTGRLRKVKINAPAPSIRIQRALHSRESQPGQDGDDGDDDEEFDERKRGAFTRRAEA